MENKDIRILLPISFLSFILLNPAEAICVPRNATPVGPSPSPGSPMNSPESIPPSPSTAAPPQSSGFEPSSSPHSPPDSNAFPYHKPSPSPELIPPPSTVAPSQSSEAAGANPPPTRPEWPNLAIKKVCDTTDYPTLCFSTLAPFLVGRELLAEPIVLLQAAIKAATVETKLAMMVLGRLIETMHADAKTLMSLKDCHDNYSDALDNFQAATDAISNRDIGTINSMLSAAVTDYGTCEDEFSGGSSPMAGQDSKLSHMADNCLAIASLIK